MRGMDEIERRLIRHGAYSVIVMLLLGALLVMEGTAPMHHIIGMQVIGTCALIMLLSHSDPRKEMLKEEIDLTGRKER